MNLTLPGGRPLQKDGESAMGGRTPEHVPYTGQSMEKEIVIAMNKNPDLQQVFSELLLIGSVFAPTGLEREQQHLREILEKCGYTLVRSECSILERNKVGDSVITIARYSVEYRDKADSSGGVQYMEGELAMQADNRGRMNMTISTRPGISPAGIPAGHPNGHLLSRRIKSIPSFLSSHIS